MKSAQTYTLKDDFGKRLNNPEFKKRWDETQLEREIGEKIIGLRIKLKMSQRALAKKLKTSQAAVCRLELAEANPTLSVLKRIAKVFGKKLVIEFR